MLEELDLEIKEKGPKIKKCPLRVSGVGWGLEGAGSRKGIGVLEGSQGSQKEVRVSRGQQSQRAVGGSQRGRELRGVSEHWRQGI